MDRLVINGSFSVGIKVYQDRNAIEVILRGRKLKFTKQGLDKAFLLYNNYFNLFNGLETLLLPNKNIKHYNGESLDDFIDMYNFDKNLSSQIFYLIISLEDKLKIQLLIIFLKNIAVRLILRWNTLILKLY